jgi:hypothetical protein
LAGRSGLNPIKVTNSSLLLGPFLPLGTGSIPVCLSDDPTRKGEEKIGEALDCPPGKILTEVNNY